MSSQKDSQERKSIFKSWLETLQQESWQLELLISGLALFGVFGAKAFIDDFENFLDTQFFSGFARISVEVFLFLLKGSWYIFLINLTIHIVLRGLWIGAIGLRYVSNDIDYEELKFSSYFRKLYTKRYLSFDDYIEDLEKICSVIFAYTFLLFFILISVSLLIFWPVLMLSLMGQPWGLLVVFFYLILGLVVFVDFIFLSPLKKIEDKWVSRIYGFIFRFYSTISLSFIFRPLLLNFLDNRFTRRLFLLSIPYGVLIILVLPQLTWDSHAYFPNFDSSNIEYRSYYSKSFNPNYYDNLRRDRAGKVNLASLHQDVIDGDVLDFFLIQLRADERYFEDVKKINKIKKTGIKSNLGLGTLKDSTYSDISNLISKEVTDFLKYRSSKKDLFTEEEWNSQFLALTEKHDRLKRAFYLDKISNIQKSFEEMHRFFLDDTEVTDQVHCMMSEHKNLNERGCGGVCLKLTV